MNSYLQLLNSLQSTNKRDQCTVVAFTSAQPAEGVSYVAGTFGVELSRKTRKRTLVADLETLQKIDIFHYSRVSRYCHPTQIKDLYLLREPDEIETEVETVTALEPRGQVRRSDIDRGISNLQTLRYVFDFVLLDCPSIKSSDTAALFAEAANAVIIVVEAGRTRKEQVLNAVNTIEMANGNLIGCVLNKRQYPVPDWLYRRI